ncbi:MAG: hypothetical protein ABIJ12_04690 [bacterium]
MKTFNRTPLIVVVGFTLVLGVQNVSDMKESDNYEIEPDPNS